MKPSPDPLTHKVDFTDGSLWSLQDLRRCLPFLFHHFLCTGNSSARDNLECISGSMADLLVDFLETLSKCPLHGSCPPPSPVCLYWRPHTSPEDEVEFWSVLHLHQLHESFLPLLSRCMISPGYIVHETRETRLAAVCLNSHEYPLYVASSLCSYESSVLGVAPGWQTLRSSASKVFRMISL